MLSGWGPMTAVATFRFPIIQYTWHTSKTSSWLTAFYDGHQYSSDTHILLTQFYPRLQVPHFDPQLPPLAIVLQSSNDENSPQHYMVLRAARPPATTGTPAPENPAQPPSTDTNNLEKTTPHDLFFATQKTWFTTHILSFSIVNLAFTTPRNLSFTSHYLSFTTHSSFLITHNIYFTTHSTPTHKIHVLHP